LKSFWEYILEENDLEFNTPFQWYVDHKTLTCELQQPQGEDYVEFIIDGELAGEEYYNYFLSGIGSLKKINKYIFKPKLGEEYWFVSYPNRNILQCKLQANEENAFRMSIHNYFKTYEEASENSYKMFELIFTQYSGLFDGINLQSEFISCKNKMR